MLIFLIGFMGAGKSYWGKQWSSANRFSFHDLDALVEAKENKTVSDIFNEDGESHFRAIESEVLQSFNFPKPCIIACGGGTPCFNNNIAWMNNAGLTVFLKATPLQIIANLQNDGAKRPLLANLSGDALQEFVEQKLTDRAQCYEAAKLTLHTRHLDTNSLHSLIDLHKNNA